MVETTKPRAAGKPLKPSEPLEPSVPFAQAWRTALPTGLTLGRLTAPLLICPLILADWSAAAAFGFALAALTDWLDGFLARRWGVSSAWGRILDPMADKVLVVLTLFALAVAGALGPLAITLTLVLVAREIGITALRQTSAAPVKGLSKIKTALQGVALTGLIWGGMLATLSLLPLAASVVLGLYTAWLYLREAQV